MPNTREKLIDILADLDCNAEYCKDCEFGNDIDGCVRRQKEIIADRLIANGVTVQKWIPVTERLPEDGKDVLCWYEYFRYGDYNSMYQTYGLGHYFKDANWGGEVSNVHRSKVLAWMPLPEPPKGE